MQYIVWGFMLRHMLQQFMISLCPVLVMSGLPLVFVYFRLFFFQVAFCVYTHVGEEINMTE
jgi:hypothetical protein